MSDTLCKTCAHNCTDRKNHICNIKNGSMSAYAEYKYARTEEEREEALSAIRWECRRDEYLDSLENEEEYDEEV